MPIFQDANGFAVKFFIQKDVPQEIQAELCETITSLGGRVESKVPRQGYILVQLGTPEEERLRLCWTSADRPDRYFVPYTFVEACKVAGVLLKQIFVENGVPIPMHIHPSIANVNARNALSLRISNSGGDPHASAQSARVILADPNTEVFQHLVKTYQGVQDKYIESYLWVKKCVEKGALVYTPLIYKNPGGRRAGEERTQFSEEDEEHLCQWIAAKIPYKETGGRTGNRLYQQLVELSSDPEYAWVTRHTWQSWRERYKKNAFRLDPIIARIVDEKKPVLGEKGQYGYVRQPEEKPKRTRKRKARNDEFSPPEEYQHDLAAAGAMAGPSHIPHMDPAMNPPHHLHHAMTMHNLAEVAHAYPGMMHIPPPVPVEGPPVRQTPAEEELEDNDESQDWAIRIGNAPPPSWAKRKSPHEDENDERNKRLRLEHEPPHPSQFGMPEHQPPLPTAALLAIANMHVIDQGIRDIAKDFRFTVEEVQEFYDKCGEMGMTRMRFQRMREELIAKFSD
ncbi:hypothetical protein CPC08DRAFT_652670 [Agrocybe pediades]|nr:hypothetical protein CPC08DRAFT_652670 [Agrocybe pediades]